MVHARQANLRLAVFGTVVEVEGLGTWRNEGAIAILDAATTTDAPDWIIRASGGGSAPEPPTDSVVWRTHLTGPDGSTPIARIARSEHGYLIDHRGTLFELQLSAGVIEVWCEKSELGLHLHLALDYGLLLALAATGTKVLHGAALGFGERALAICGASGRGKSTTAAVMASAGWSLLTDDAIALDTLADPPIAELGHRHLRLTAAGLEKALGPDAVGVAEQAGAKSLVPSHANALRSAPSRLPLSVIVELDPNGPVAPQQAPPRMATQIIMRNSFRLVTGTADDSIDFVAQSAALATRIPVWSWRRPDGVDNLRDALPLLASLV